MQAGNLGTPSYTTSGRKVATFQLPDVLIGCLFAKPFLFHNFHVAIQPQVKKTGIFT